MFVHATAQFNAMEVGSKNTTRSAAAGALHDASVKATGEQAIDFNGARQHPWARDGTHNFVVKPLPHPEFRAALQQTVFVVCPRGMSAYLALWSYGLRPRAYTCHGWLLTQGHTQNPSGCTKLWKQGPSPLYLVPPRCLDSHLTRHSSQELHQHPPCTTSMLPSWAGAIPCQSYVGRIQPLKRRAPPGRRGLCSSLRCTGCRGLMGGQVVGDWERGLELTIRQLARLGTMGLDKLQADVRSWWLHARARSVEATSGVVTAAGTREHAGYLVFPRNLFACAVRLCSFPKRRRTAPNGPSSSPPVATHVLVRLGAWCGSGWLDALCVCACVCVCMCVRACVRAYDTH